MQFYYAATNFGACRLLSKLEKYQHGRGFRTGNDLEGNDYSGRLVVYDNLGNPEPIQTHEVRRDDVRRRVNELGGHHALNYPRMENDNRAVTCAAFRRRYSFLKPGESSQDEKHTIRGRCFVHLWVDDAEIKNCRKGLLNSNSRIKVSLC